MTESHVHVIKLIQNDRITCARHKVKQNDRITCARHKVKTE